jgi:hypothetical protein
LDTSFSCNTPTSSTSQVEKVETLSIIHKQAQIDQQEERKMKKDEMKKKKTLWV